MLTSVVVASIVSISIASAFNVDVPQGPKGSELKCSSYATVSWDAHSMPEGTDKYDVSLHLANGEKKADNQTVVGYILRGFPQDDPPVGFANFYPALGKDYAGKSDFQIRVTAKSSTGEVLGEGESPVFVMPVCQDAAEGGEGQEDQVVDEDSTGSVDTVESDNDQLVDDEDNEEDSEDEEKIASSSDDAYEKANFDFDNEEEEDNEDEEDSNEDGNNSDAFESDEFVEKRAFFNNDSESAESNQSSDNQSENLQSDNPSDYFSSENNNNSNQE